ncbi:MAG: hypothetical protein QGI93_08185 [Planctomycetota bacterium]|nr:hypothetical protein [Planctomycetota bacterium]
MNSSPVRALCRTVPLLVLLSGCHVSTQRYPGPMVAAVDPLPPGTTSEYPAGPEEVLVVRIADPVHVRRPGQSANFPLYFYAKQARLNAGSWVFCGAGGRAEIILGGGASVLLIGHGTGVIGSPSRDEPVFFFHEVETAVVHFPEAGQQVRLPGGAILDAEKGPFVIEHESEDILRVRNRSKRMGRLAYLDEQFQLSPGDVIDLPILGGGMSPREEDPGFQTQTDVDRRLSFRGDVVLTPRGKGVRIRATGKSEVVGHGLRLRLEKGQEAWIDDFVTAAPAVAPVPVAVPPVVPDVVPVSGQA